MTDFSRDDIADSMSSFEAAVSAPHVEIPAVAPKTILLALDGSNQDPAAVALATAVAANAGATSVQLTFAYEGPPDAGRDSYLAEQARHIAARAAQLVVGHSRAGTPPGAAEAARPFQQILELAEERHCDLIVTVAPYLDDYAQLGTASTGTNLDMLLRRRRTPLLVVREPYADVEGCLEHLIVPLNLLGARGPEALAWAFRLVAPASGTVHLLAVADTEAMEAAAPLVGRPLEPEEIDERELANLVSSPATGLVAAAQRRAAEANIACRVSIRVGHPLGELLEFARQQQRSLIAAGCPENCSATGYLRVQALIRESPDPVLVV